MPPWRLVRCPYSITVTLTDPSARADTKGQLSATMPQVCPALRAQRQWVRVWLLIEFMAF